MLATAAYQSIQPPVLHAGPSYPQCASTEPSPLSQPGLRSCRNRPSQELPSPPLPAAPSSRFNKNLAEVRQRRENKHPNSATPYASKPVRCEGVVVIQAPGVDIYGYKSYVGRWGSESIHIHLPLRFEQGVYIDNCLMRHARCLTHLRYVIF